MDNRYALEHMRSSVHPGAQFVHCRFWYRHCKHDSLERAFGGRFSVDTRATVNLNGPVWQQR